jgi:hypothetical protein
MGRNRSRSPVYLHPEKAKALPMGEIQAILRGADSLVGKGGRSLLTKLLRGSRDKRILEHDLQHVPVYGCFLEYSEEEVRNKIDWLIEHHFLGIEYDGRLPMLVFEPLGWEIERETHAGELFATLSRMANEWEQPTDWRLFTQCQRDVAEIILSRVSDSGDIRFATLLQSWQISETRKRKALIQRVLNDLTARTV